MLSMAACGNPEGNGGSSEPPSSSADSSTVESTGGSEVTPSSDEVQPATPAEVVKPDTIKVMWDGTVFKEGDNYAEEFYAALDEALGLHVEWVRPDHSTYAEQVGIAFTDQNTLADVIILPSNYYASYAAQGSLWNMTDAWKKSDTATSGRLSSVGESIVNQWYVTGPDGQEGIYGM